MQTSFFQIDDTISIAYQKFPGKNPGVIFCCGFMSDMQSTKATSVQAFCRQHGHAFLKFDYRGHGQSAGELAHCSINTWLQDSLKLFDQVTEGPQIIVGSSMGSWIATLIARERAQQVAGLLCIAAAPDFTEDLMWAELSPAERSKLECGETLYAPSQYSETPYAISPQLINESRQHLLLRKTIPVNCKVRLLHGMQDPDVPWQVSLQLTNQLQANDVQLTLIKDGDHRLCREGDLKLLWERLAELVAG